MIKFVLILHLCTFLNATECFQEQVVGLEFDDHYSCMLQGYRHAHKQIESLGEDRVNTLKLGVKFECKEIKIQKI